MSSAKGIPSRSNYGDLGSLPVDVPVTLVRQLHDAKRAGRHQDLRIGTSGGMFSWALPKGLPEKPGDKKLAIRQPLHSWSYNDFEGRIGKGYGTGTVSRLEKSPVVLLVNTPGKIVFTRGDSRHAPVYTMIRTKSGNWLVMMKGDDIPLSVKTYSKEHFRSVGLDKIADVMDAGSFATPKLDGAGALASLGEHGIRVFGIRPDKDGNPIEYTDHIGGLRGLDIPKDLVGTTLRGEVIAERNGRVLPPQELSGYLNSLLIKAAAKRISDGTNLRMAPLAVVGERDDYGRERIEDIIRRVKTPKFISIPSWTKEDAIKAVERMREGRYPLTSEGIVIHGSGQRPVKAKLVDDADVVISGIFPSEGRDASKAGGFAYSLPGGGKEVGRVGSGLGSELLSDMMKSPSAYIGRTARIRHFGQYGSGAYRSPSFISMKED